MRLSCTKLAYFYTLKVSKYRYAVSILIMSSHILHIETGIWSMPRTINLLFICINLNVMEDDFHFVLECKWCSEI